MSDISIKVENVSKSFKLPHEKYTGLKQAVINFRPGKKYDMQHVLTDVSFEIKKGEFFGIVGRNGSGKSTLLKLLAQIYTSDEGGITISGTLTPFIELGVGFNPELTGRENVYLNGALLGFDHDQVDEMYEDIVSFAELDPFMDQKLKNYSSGMQVRLAFSVAIRAKSDILLIDEVLAVGDAAFQQKCFRYFDQLKEEGRTIVFVSHDMSAVKQFCDRALLVEKGRVVAIGDPVDIALEYERYLFGDEASEAEPLHESEDIKIFTLDEKNNPVINFEYGKAIVFKSEWSKKYEVGIVGFSVHKGAELIFATNTINQKDKFDINSAALKIYPKFGNGRYRLTVGLFGQSRHDVIKYLSGYEFSIYGQPQKGKNKDEWEGVIYTDNRWL